MRMVLRVVVCTKNIYSALVLWVPSRRGRLRGLCLLLK